jgi:autotransporter-associated beta strand protein
MLLLAALSLQAQPATLAINCGGAAYTNAAGTVFAADSYYSGGSTYSSGAAIAGTTDDVLYQSERWVAGTLGYSFPLANGKYEVTLMFAEIYFNAASNRVFNVSLEGSQVITNLDIWAKAGKDAAYNATNIVSVYDGQLDIALNPVINNPKISAIKVARIEMPVLFVVGNATNLNASELAISNRLQTYGFTVQPVGDSASTTGDAAGKNLVLISSTVTSGNVNTKFREVAVPVINWEYLLEDDFGFTGDADALRFTTGSQAQISMTNTAHPLAAGLAGIQTVTAAPSSFSWGEPGGSPIIIGRLNDGSGHPCLYAYETNAPMSIGNAAARRVHIFLNNDTFAALNATGVTLFDAAVSWTTGQPLPSAAPDSSLLSSLVAYYTFNNSGSLGADSSTNGNTLTGTMQYSGAGKFGGALYLNGSSTLTVAGGFPKGVPTNNASYSIACWIKPDVGCPLNVGIIGWGIQSRGNGDFLRLNGGKNDLDNYWWDYDLLGALPSGTFFDGYWHLAVATWDGTNRAIYIDTIQVATSTESKTNLNVSPVNFKVGTSPSSGTFKGWMDNLMIANRAFTKAEVTWLLNQNLQPPVFPIDAPLVVNAPDVHDLNGSDLDVGSLAGNGTITSSLNNAVILTTGYAGTNTSFTGSIAATNLTLVKLGGGMQTLAGTNRYLGQTLVNAGTLWLSGGSLNSTLVKVAGSPTFGSAPPAFGGDGTVAGSVNYSVDSIPLFTNGSTLTINGSMVANSNLVHLRLANNVTAGTYLLATYNPVGSSGSFSRVPEVDAGSFAPYTQYRVTNYVVGGVGKVELVVTSIPANTPIAGVNVYEPVPGLQASVQYAVRVCAATNASSWNSVFTFETRAQPSWSPDEYYTSLKDWTHSYANFEMTVPVTVEISRVNGQPITSVTVRPERKAKNIYVSGGKAYLTLNQPCNVGVDIDGQMETHNTGEWAGPPIHTISIHGNPVLTNKPPAANGAGVYYITPGTTPPQTGSWTTMYFLPGVHYLGTDFQVYAGKNYYLPGDAILHATLNNRFSGSGSNLRIFGHGTLSGERFKHWKYLPDGTGSRAIDINNISGIRVEGITITDPGNHSMIMWSPYNASNPTLVDGVKIVTWRANGDGINIFDNGLIKNCFIRTQDDGNYVNGHRISDLVMWVDANGTSLRLSLLPNLTSRTLMVENIDVIYSRSRWWSHSSPLCLPTDSGDKGAGVIFTNLNFPDPFPDGPAIAILQGDTGAFAGARFENLTIAAVTNSSGSKSRLESQGSGSVHDLTFNNLVIGGTLVTSNNWLNYFTTNGNVYNIFFTRTDFTAPVVAVTPGTTNFSSSLPVSLAVNGDFGYYSRNGGPYVSFTTAGADLLLTNTATLSVYGRDAVGNVSGTNTFTYTLSVPPAAPAVLTGVTMSPAGNLSFSVTNAGGIYRVQTHTNLANPAGWISISTNTAPFTFTDTNVLGAYPQRFYRVVTP